ncbi:MAG: phosphatidate cytidylyltransferase [Pirellulales bacterium]
MLRWRLLIGAALIALLVALFWLDAAQIAGTRPAAWLFPLLIAVAALGSSDLSYLYAARGWRPSPLLLTAGNVAIVAINLVPTFVLPPGHRAANPWAWPIVVFLVCVLAAFVVEIRRYRTPGDAVLNIALLIFGWSYVGLLLTTLIELRVGQATPAFGVLAVGSMILFVKLGDIGAYTLGRLFGRHKMTPTLSPGRIGERLPPARRFLPPSEVGPSTCIG